MHHNKQGRDWNHGESDHEGSMAVAQLHRLNDISSMLLDFISENDELPGWVQYKLTRAYTDLNDIFGYIEPQADSEMLQTQMNTQTALPHVQTTESKKKRL